jgi:hypothetical protein
MYSLLLFAHRRLLLYCGDLHHRFFYLLFRIYCLRELCYTKDTTTQSIGNICLVSYDFLFNYLGHTDNFNK